MNPLNSIRLWRCWCWASSRDLLETINLPFSFSSFAGDFYDVGTRRVRRAAVADIFSTPPPVELTRQAAVYIFHAVEQNFPRR